MDTLVSTEWLAGEMAAGDLRILDATWLMPGQGDAALAFEQAHIPGAAFLDLNAVVDADCGLPMMLPDAARFAEAMGALGVGDGDRVVIYDGSPYRTAARAWFMCRTFGMRDVAILDGGLGKWRAEGRPLATGREDPSPRALTTAVADRRQVRTIGDMRAVVAQGGEQIVDARSAARYSAEEPEPRPDMAGGHMPGARNLPIARMFAADGTYKSTDALAAAFRDAGVDIDRPVVTTCGSGVTASVLLFALHRLGRNAALYDGSWSEWGADPSTPKVTGAA